MKVSIKRDTFDVEINIEVGADLWDMVEVFSTILRLQGYSYVKDLAVLKEGGGVCYGDEEAWDEHYKNILKFERIESEMKQGELCQENL